MVGRFGEAILIDWGLASTDNLAAQPVEISQVDINEQAQIQTENSGALLGTPAYMSPEQAAGRLDLVDCRTDVYGLGTVLFEILAGKPPHGGTSMHELLQKIEENPPPAAFDECPGVPRALNAVCLKAMAKLQEDRYASATDLANDVANWLADVPTSVFADPFVDRVTRWVRKHRVWAVASFVLLVMIAVVSSVATAFVNSARESEQIARTQAFDRLQDAQETIDESLTGIDELLRYFPSARTIRLRFLRKAADDYAKFASTEPENLPLAIEAGRARVRLGNTQSMLGETDKASATLKQAAEYFDQVKNRFGPSPELELESAFGQVQLARILAATGEYSKAAKLFESSISRILAIDDYRDIVGANRKTIVSDARIDLAEALLAIDQSEKANQQFQLAIESLDEQLKKNDESIIRASLARALQAKAQWQLRIIEPRKAVVAASAAISLYQDLLKREPNHPPWLEGRSVCRITLANTQSDLGNEKAALENHVKAVGACDDFWRAVPGVARYKDSALIARVDAAISYHHLGRNVEAADVISSGMNQTLETADETLVSAYAILGIVYAELDLIDDALNALEISLERLNTLLDANSQTGLLRLSATVQSHIARLIVEGGTPFADVEPIFLQVESKLRDLVAENDVDFDTKSTLAFVYQQHAEFLFEKEPKTATRLYGQAALLWKECPDHLRFQHGYMWLLLNCRDESVREFRLANDQIEKLLARSADSPRVLNLAAFGQLRIGEFEQARKYAESSFKLMPEGNSGAPAILAVCHARANRSDDARKSIELAEKILTEQHPNNRNALQLLRECKSLAQLAQ
jgi:tetratricopeptide (TPR) repeat protein